MSSIRVCLGLVLCLAATTSIRGQTPSGYHLGGAVTLPDSLDEVFSAGRFTASVRRAVANPEDRQLIDIAERIYPNQEIVLSSARNPTDRDRLLRDAAGISRDSSRFPVRPAGTPADRWWLGDFDGTWISFAVTGGAVGYYLGRMRDLAAGRGKFVYQNGQKPDNGSFFYQASVRAVSEPGISKVVELEIKWDYWCGMVCAVHFTHKRLVFFDEKGSVLRITGDGEADLVFS